MTKRSRRNLACCYLDRLRSGQVPLEELAITQPLSRDPRAYVQHTLNAIVAQQLLASGVELSAGHRIHYVIVENQAKAYADRARALEHLDGSLGYDAERYGELLLRAVEAVLAPVGIHADTLQQWIKQELPATEKRARLVVNTHQYWVPLFAFVKREERKRSPGIISKKQNTRRPE